MLPTGAITSKDTPVFDGVWYIYGDAACDATLPYEEVDVKSMMKDEVESALRAKSVTNEKKLTFDRD